MGFGFVISFWVTQGRLLGYFEGWTSGNRAISTSCSALGKVSKCDWLAWPHIDVSASSADCDESITRSLLFASDSGISSRAISSVGNTKRRFAHDRTE